MHVQNVVFFTPSHTLHKSLVKNYRLKTNKYVNLGSYQGEVDIYKTEKFI